MEGIQASTAVRKRLALQQEVMKFLVDFSEKLETRAKSTTKELNELLNQSVLVELEMKNTLISFDNLAYHQNINHRASDGDHTIVNNAKLNDESRANSIPAQDYEKDILPRYKEALSLGITSCNEAFKNKNRSKGSVLRAMSTQNYSLPYIIGSEEYTHDDTCGLTVDDFTIETNKEEFHWINEPNNEGISDREISDLFGSQQSSNKGESEPYVRAAQDFKAMLEAALLNPYKFYENSSGENSNSAITKNNEDEITPIRLEETSLDKNTPLEENILKEETENIYSSLVTGSLFDADDSFEIVEEKDENEIGKESSDEY